MVYDGEAPRLSHILVEYRVVSYFQSHHSRILDRRFQTVAMFIPASLTFPTSLPSDPSQHSSPLFLVQFGSLFPALSDSISLHIGWRYHCSSIYRVGLFQAEYKNINYCNFKTDKALRNWLGVEKTANFFRNYGLQELWDSLLDAYLPNQVLCFDDQ